MRGPVKNLYNATVLKPNGGIVQCSCCKRVTGRIEGINYKYIEFAFVCKCGEFGKAELYRGKHPHLSYPNRALYNKESVFICQNCERPLFWVKEDAVLNYAFNVICKCGVEYDIKFERNWKDSFD